MSPAALSDANQNLPHRHALYSATLRSYIFLGHNESAYGSVRSLYSMHGVSSPADGRGHQNWGLSPCFVWTSYKIR